MARGWLNERRLVSGWPSFVDAEKASGWSECACWTVSLLLCCFFEVFLFSIFS